MIFGDHQLGIEISNHERNVGAIRVWLRGRHFGSGVEPSILSAYQADAARFFRRSEKVADSKFGLSGELVRAWYTSVLEEEPTSLAQAEKVDAIIYSSELFPFSPDVFASTHFVFLFGDTECSVTGWAELEEESTHQVCAAKSSRANSVIHRHGLFKKSNLSAEKVALVCPLLKFAR